MDIAHSEGLRDVLFGKSRSLEIEPSKSIHLSSDAQSLENGYRRRGSLVHFAM